MTKTRNLADLGGGFIQAGTGAVQRTVESKLQDVVSVKDFGAVGDGVADDTAAIQAAIDAANTGSNKAVYFSAGTYKVSKLSVTLQNSTIAFVGDTRGASTLKLTTTPAQGYSIEVYAPVSITYPNPAAGIWGIRFEGITFDGTSVTSTQAALYLERCHGAVVKNCFFNKCPSGIYLKDCFFAVVEDVGIWDLLPATGVGIYIDGQQDQYINRVHVDSIAPGGYQYEGLAAVQIVKSGLFNIQSMDVAHVRNGLLINPTTGQLVEWGFVGPAYFDQCSSYGIDINPSGGTVKGLMFNGTWAATCGTGVRVTGTGTINGFTFNNMRVYNCVNNGFNLLQGSNISICGGSRISQNGVKVSGTCNTSGTTVTLISGEANTTWPGNTIVINSVTYTIATIVTSTQITLTASAGTQSGVAYSFSRTAYGVNLNGAVSRVKIADNFIGQIDGHDTDQDYGVSVNNGANNCEIVNNDFTGNGSAPIAWNVTNTNQSFVIKDNIGLDNQLPTIASASSINVGMLTNAILSGTTTITEIAGPKWYNRVFTFYPQGAVTFSAGPTIRNTFTTTASVPVIAYCDGSAWYLK